jgi:hypothetical protein
MIKYFLLLFELPAERQACRELICGIGFGIFKIKLLDPPEAASKNKFENLFGH